MRITPIDHSRQATGLFNQQRSPRPVSAQLPRVARTTNRLGRSDFPVSIAQHLQMARPAPARHMEAIERIAERAGQPNTPGTRFLISALLLSQLSDPALTRAVNPDALSERQTGISRAAPETLPSLAASTGLFDRYRRSPSAALSAAQMPVSDIATPAAEHETLNYVVTEPVVQAAVLSHLASLLQRSGMLPADRVDAFEHEYARMGSELVMTVDYVPAGETFSAPQRGRRVAANAAPSALFVNGDASVRGQPLNINPCRIGITSSQGGKGDSYIVAGNYLEDPFRDLLENAGQPPTFWQQFSDLALNGLVTVVTLGIKDAVAFPIAHGLRSQGHMLNNEPVCTRGEWAPNQLAVWATTLTLEHGEVPTPHFTPVTERVVLAAAARAEPGVVRSTPAHLKSVRDPVTGRHLEARKLADGHYVVIDPEAATPALKVRPLLANEAGDIHLAGPPSDHSVESRFGFESNTVIVDDHILSTQREGLVSQYLEREFSGHPVRTPVEIYKDKLSGVSHRATENGNPLFSDEDKVYLGRISTSMEYWFAEPSMRFIALPEPPSNTVRDRTGPIYRVYSAGDERVGTLAQGYLVADVGGHIVPIELGPLGPSSRDITDRLADWHLDPGEQYYARPDYGNEGRGPNGGRRPIEFDGHRWTFVKATRPAVAPELDSNSQMGWAMKTCLENPLIRQSALKANSVHGLWRHLETGLTYLKMNGKFVRVDRSEGGFVATDPANEIRIPLALRERAGELRENASAAVETKKEYSLSWKTSFTEEGEPMMNVEELIVFSGASHNLYAVDVRSPEQVQQLGFSDSQSMVVPNMLGREPAVEVYESLDAARKRVELLRRGGEGQPLYIYDVNAENLPGVSLNQNAFPGIVDEFLQRYPEHLPLMEVTPNDRFGSNTWRSMVVNTGGRIYYEPAHLRASDLSPSQMARYPNRVKQVPESYLQALPRLEEGLWTRTLPELIM